jgi:hypothetical protein
MYNEEFLLPFFLKHYDWVDKINVIYDQDSTDQTLKILKSNPKINIIPFKFPDMMDDVLKTQKVNQEYSKIHDCCRVLVVDADEFIFTDKIMLKKINYPVVYVKLFNVFRHKSEGDLDINKPIKDQRRHGFYEDVYHKPIIAKSGLDLLWGLGNHNITRTPRSPKNLPIKIKQIVTGQREAKAFDCGIIGAHWSNADPVFCIDRRVRGRRDRQSKSNLEHGYTYQHHHITEESVLAECKQHENDPLVF